MTQRDGIDLEMFFLRGSCVTFDAGFGAPYWIHGIDQKYATVAKLGVNMVHPCTPICSAMVHEMFSANALELVETLLLAAPFGNDRMNLRIVSKKKHHLIVSST